MKIARNYREALFEAESVVSNPSNRRKNGELKLRQQRRLSRLINRVAYLSQFETIY